MLRNVYTHAKLIKMGKGRKVTSDNLKIMKGTDQKCRMTGKGTSLSVISKVPPAPSWFNPLARTVYMDVARELLAQNLLHIVGLPLVISYCNTIAVHLQLEEQLSTEGRFITIETKNGLCEAISPKHKASLDTLDKALKISAEFGFTPISQQRIISQVTEKDNNDKFFN